MSTTRIDVLRKLSQHPSATFVMRVFGDSMVEYGTLKSFSPP